MAFLSLEMGMPGRPWAQGAVSLASPSWLAPVAVQCIAGALHDQINQGRPMIFREQVATFEQAH
jgi:hypothetical protein